MKDDKWMYLYTLMMKPAFWLPCTSKLFSRHRNTEFCYAYINIKKISFLPFWCDFMLKKRHYSSVFIYSQAGSNAEGLRSKYRFKPVHTYCHHCDRAWINRLSECYGCPPATGCDYIAVVCKPYRSCFSALCLISLPFIVACRLFHWLEHRLLV